MSLQQARMSSILHEREYGQQRTTRCGAARTGVSKSLFLCTHPPPEFDVACRQKEVHGSIRISGVCIARTWRQPYFEREPFPLIGGPCGHRSLSTTTARWSQDFTVRVPTTVVMRVEWNHSLIGVLRLSGHAPPIPPVLPERRCLPEFHGRP